VGSDAFIHQRYSLVSFHLAYAKIYHLDCLFVRQQENIPRTQVAVHNFDLLTGRDGRSQLLEEFNRPERIPQVGIISGFHCLP